MSFKIGFDSDINCAWKTISDYVSTKGYIELEVLAEKTSDFNFQDALFSASKFHYIKAERLGPRDDFKIDETKTDEKDFGTDGRYAFQYYNRKKNSDLPITNLCHSKETSPLLKDQMAAWLSEISPNVNIHTEERDGLLYPAFSFGIRGQEHKPKNVGFGISYAFVVILALLTAEKGDLIIIENPEAHLHPKGQSKMTELMALAAQNGVQIFCETHSDHIFNASRLCAKKQMIEAEKIALYYFTKKQDYSEAILINMDKNGAIDKRPKGLFDEWGIILDQLID
jgi:predicted ATPase